MSYTSSPAWYDSSDLHSFIDYEYEQQSSEVYIPKVDCEVKTDDSKLFVLSCGFPWIDDRLLPFFSSFYRVCVIDFNTLVIEFSEATKFLACAEREIREVFDLAVYEVFNLDVKNISQVAQAA